MTRRTAGRCLAVILVAGAVCAVFTAGAAVAAGPFDWAGDQWTRFSAWVFENQRQYHRELAASVRAVKADASIAAIWTLVVGSFVYGVLHAAGPGHGKAILSAYLLTHESRIRLGLWVALAAALLQGVTAVVLVEGARELIGWTSRDAYAASGTLESISFALIAALGVMLAWRGIRSFRRSRHAGRAVVPHDHHHHPPAEHGHDHSHDHSHGHADCHEGHVHIPTPDQLARQGWRSIAGMTLSIGIRPCSGAVMVLIVAGLMDLRVPGMLAVLAMSLGTAAAVAGLAVLAVGARNLAAALARTRYDNLALATHIVAAVGGVLIALMGILLFWGSLGPAHPLLP
jgi:nickel/cobalt transporter (NicO) family protein